LVSATDADGELDPKQRSILGNLFRRYDRRLFNDKERKLRFRVQGRGHKRSFIVIVE